MVQLAGQKSHLKRQRKTPQTASHVIIAMVGDHKEFLVHDAELELQTIYDSAPLGLCLLGLDLRILRLNKRLAEMHGLRQ